MPLVIRRTWNSNAGENKICNHLKKIFNSVKHDVYLYHNVLIGNHSEKNNGVYLMRPDFIIVDPQRGIAIVEVKSWKEFKLEGNFAIFKNTSKDLNPIIKSQNYFFNLSNILKINDVVISKDLIKCHLVFDNLFFNNKLHGDFVTSHFNNYGETLSLETMFNSKEMIISDSDLTKIMQFLDPVVTFLNQKSDANENVLELDKIQSEIVCHDPYGHYLVSGVPGSGKSIMVASRAAYLIEKFPDWKILILTVNKNLKTKINNDINQRFKDKINFKIQDFVECKTLISFLESCCSVDKKIESKKILSYSEVVLFYRQNALPTHQYDAILVDEYQDFTDEDFRIILENCKKYTAIINNEERKTENLFLTGDKLQQIWEDGCSHSWAKIGINIRGNKRSTILKTSYRSPTDISLVALEFLIENGLSEEVKIFYEGIDKIKYLNEKKDSIEILFGWDSDAAVFCSKIKKIVDEGVLPEDILIISGSSKNNELLKSIFTDEVKHGMIIGTKDEIKGLEAKYVFIYNLDIYDFIYKGRKNKNKAKVIYMCLTRAREYVCVSSFKKDESIKILEDIILNVKKQNDAA